MKILLLVLTLFAAPLWAQCSSVADCEAQIESLRLKLQEHEAAEVVVALNATIQADAQYASIKAAGVTIVSARSSASGNYDPEWVGVDIPVNATISSDDKTSAIAFIKAKYNGQDTGDADVRVRAWQLAEVASVLDIFAQ